MSVTPGERNRFEDDVSRYAVYLETPEGRLRSDLAFAGLQEFLPALSRLKTLTAVDIGAGTGSTAIRLARLGFDVTLLDSSPSMLELAEQMAIKAGVRDKITQASGDATQVGKMFPSAAFDVAVCHNVLEYVDEPFAVLRGIAQVMRRDSGLLSVLVRNQAGEVLKAAIRSGDLSIAENALTAESGQEYLYGGHVRLFASDALEEMLRLASFKVVARRGVRVVSDYLPEQIDRFREFDRILALERRLSNRQEFIGVARYLHYIAKCEIPSAA